MKTSIRTTWFHRMLIAAAAMAIMTTSARADDQIERKEQTVPQHHQTAQTLTSKGYVPIYVKAFVVNGQVRIDTVYDKESCQFEMRVGMSPQVYFQLDQDLRDAGYKRVSHSVHNFGPQVFHAAVWHKKN